MMDSTFRNHSTSANLKTHQRTDHWATLEEILLADPSQNFLESETISAKRDDFNLTRTPQDFDYEDGWVDKKDDTALCASRNQSGRSFQEVHCPSIEYPRNSKSGYHYHSHSRLDSERPVQYYTEQVPNQLEREDSYSTMIAEDIIESPIRFQATIPAKQLPSLHFQADNAFDLELDFLSPMPKKAKQIQEDHSVLLSTGISGCESTPSRTMRLDSKFQGPNDLLMSDATIHQSDLELESLETHAKFPRKISNETGLKGRCEGSKTLEQELAEFNPVCDPCGIDNETLEYLYERERDYAPDPFYLKNKQSQLTWSMRAILIDWMLEVSMEFTLKRETFHAAVNYVDRFLSLYPNLQRQELQLIGVVSLFTSAKNEEIFSFQAEDFAKACDGAYTTAEIVKAEGVLLKTLKWMLVPPTFNSWSQWYLSQWDLYIEKAPFISNQNLAASVQESLLVQFRQPNERSYTLFREFMQYIDCIVLDIEHLQYDRRTIIAALMYLLLGKEYQQFSTKQIVEELRTTSTRLFSKSNVYNDLFADFLAYSFGFELEEILPSLQYVAPFFLLPLNYDLPRAVQIKGESALEGHFEDFLSYQTHHRQALEFLRKMKAKGTP